MTVEQAETQLRVVVPIEEEEVCLVNTNGVLYALIFNKRPLKKIRNTVSCMHNTMECAT
jgi:hypothetical protein